MRRRLLLRLVLTGLIAVSAVRADSVITMRVTAGAGDGENATKTTWVQGARIREDDGTRSVIVDLDGKTLLLIDHESKTYHELDLPLDIAAMMPESARSAYRTMIEQMNMKVDIRPTEQTAEIGGYKATRTDVGLNSEMGVAMEWEIWSSPDVPIDIERYKSMMGQMAGLQPAGGDWMRKMLEIPGFPVRMVNRAQIQGHDVERVQELVSVEERSAPEGFYAAPAGYEKTPFDPMAGMRGR